MAGREGTPGSERTSGSETPALHTTLSSLEVTQTAAANAPSPPYRTPGGSAVAMGFEFGGIGEGASAPGTAGSSTSAVAAAAADAGMQTEAADGQQLAAQTQLAAVAAARGGAGLEQPDLMGMLILGKPVYELLTPMEDRINGGVDVAEKDGDASRGGGGEGEQQEQREGKDGWQKKGAREEGDL